MEKPFGSNSSSSSAISSTAKTTVQSAATNVPSFRRSPWSWLTNRRSSRGSTLNNSSPYSSAISPCMSRKKMSSSSLPSIGSNSAASGLMTKSSLKVGTSKTLLKLKEQQRSSSFKRFGGGKDVAARGQPKFNEPSSNASTKSSKSAAAAQQHAPSCSLLDTPMKFIDSAASPEPSKKGQTTTSFWYDYQKYQSSCFYTTAKAAKSNAQRRSSSNSAVIRQQQHGLLPFVDVGGGGWGTPSRNTSANAKNRKISKEKTSDIGARASSAVINQSQSLKTTKPVTALTGQNSALTAGQKNVLTQHLQSSSGGNTPEIHSSSFIHTHNASPRSLQQKAAEKSPASRNLPASSTKLEDIILHSPIVEHKPVALAATLAATTSSASIKSATSAEQKSAALNSSSATSVNKPKTEHELPAINTTKHPIYVKTPLLLSRNNASSSTPTKQKPVSKAQAVKQNLFKEFRKRSSFASFGEMRKVFAKAVTGSSGGGTSTTTSSSTSTTVGSGDTMKSTWLGSLRGGGEGSTAGASAPHGPSSAAAGRHSPTKVTSSATSNGGSDMRSNLTALVADKERIIAELERRLRASEMDNDRLKKELDKVKSVLSITHSPNKIAAAAAAGRRVAHDAAAIASDGFEAANQLNIDEDVQQESEKATPVVGGSREYATKKVAISAESGVMADVKLEKVEKDFRSKHLIKNAILDNDFLKHLDAAQVKDMVEYMYPMQVPGNCYIIRQAEEGNHLYVLAVGSLTVEKDGTSLGRIEAGKAFGELAILYGCNRTASVKSNDLAKLWVLDRKVFQKIMIRNTTERQQDLVKLLRSVPVLSTLNDLKLRKVADALEVDFYSAGDFIIRQGETGDYFFILNKGEVKITQHVPGSGERIINTLKKGDFFGEKALVREEKRTASVIAITDTECLALNREAFTSLIGDIKDIIDKEYLHDARRESLPPTSGMDSSRQQTAITPMPSPEEEVKHIIERPTPADFAIVATLGVGGFGRVVLVQHRALKDRTFAMKVMKKRHIVKTRQQEHVMSEKDILLRCKSPFICKLFATMKDRKYLYMLMEFLQGGELWTILRDCTFFDEVTVKFYTACALAALEYLHERCIIYRDLKPENMMLDSNGYGKLVDFGFAKNIEVNRKTWTFCGTPQYMSPEIILNKGHDHAVDYYALGIFMYELSTGTPPFEYNGDQLQCYNQILRGISAVEFPRHMSRGCISLIKRLCRLTAVERLGYQKGGVKDIKKHKFFQGFDWHGLAKRTIPAPIKPTIKSPTDTANFDEGFPADNEVVDDDTSGWDENF